MNLPGYYLSDPGLDSSGSDDLVTLPVQERYGSTIGIEESDIDLVTERGVRYVYEQFERPLRRMVFRCTLTELEDFKTMRAAVRRQPFWYVPDTDDLSTVIYCRRERDFMPKELDGPAAVNDQDEPVYDYELTIKGEIDPVDIEA